MGDMVKVVIVPVDEEAYITEIKNDLNTMQKVVGGFLETVPTETDDIFIIVNEEGMIHELPMNILGFYGDFFVVGVNGSEFSSLSEHHSKLILDYMNSQK